MNVSDQGVPYFNLKKKNGIVVNLIWMLRILSKEFLPASILHHGLKKSSQPNPLVQEDTLRVMITRVAMLQAGKLQDDFFELFNTVLTLYIPLNILWKCKAYISA